MLRTKQQVKEAFAATTGALTDGQKMCLLKIEKVFTDTAIEVMDLVPDSPDRTAAIRKLLEAKMTCSQAITHPLPETTKEKQHGSK